MKQLTTTQLLERADYLVKLYREKHNKSHCIRYLHIIHIVRRRLEQGIFI